jgi:hypothetical protein
VMVRISRSRRPWVCVAAGLLILRHFFDRFLEAQEGPFIILKALFPADVFGVHEFGIFPS